jgi:hypothetical protein
MVFFAPNLCFHFANTLNQPRVSGHVVVVVKVVPHSRIDANRSSKAASIVSGMFQGLPRKFHEDSLLRVHNRGICLADIEKRGIKKLRILKHAPCPNIARITFDLLVKCGVVFFSRKTSNGIAALNKMVPELLNRVCAWKSARHANYCYLVLIFVDR